MNAFTTVILVAFILGCTYAYFDSKGKIWTDQEIIKKEKPYQVHYYWTHIIGQLAGWLTLYGLYTHLEFDWNHAIFLIIALLGITGYIPRFLWFISNRGDFLKG